MKEEGLPVGVVLPSYFVLLSSGVPVAQTAAKVMFEIYREAGYARKFRVVYFTELDEHNKEAEINRAMAGEHLYDGFLAERQIVNAKAAVDQILTRLNSGETLDADQIAEVLQPFST
jgi:hypothetical protein